jgi:uncharacterized protein
VSAARRFLLFASTLPLLVIAVGCAADGSSESTTSSVGSQRSATTSAPTTVPPVQPEGFDLARAEVTVPSGEVCVLCLWVAKTERQRQRGLMAVTDLGVADGMAFVYDEPSNGQFWMRDTPLPLSIAFFAADGRFVSSRDMEPCLTGPSEDCARYAATGPYVTAIEAPQGGLADLGIRPGSRLELFLGSACDL